MSNAVGALFAAPTALPVDLTPHHARYFALELQRRGLAGQVQAVGAALFDARVDLNPHQVEAALFGLRASVEQGRRLYTIAHFRCQSRG